MKTPRFALNNLFLETLAVIVDVNVSVEKKVFSVFPLEKSFVAKQPVVMAGLVRELAHKHRAVTSTLMLEEQRHRKRGF